MDPNGTIEIVYPNDNNNNNIIIIIILIIKRKKINQREGASEGERWRGRENILFFFLS